MIAPGVFDSFLWPGLIHKVGLGQRHPMHKIANCLFGNFEKHFEKSRPS